MGKMNEIETMYWNAFVDYLTNLESDTFVIKENSNTNIITVKYDLDSYKDTTEEFEIMVNFYPNFNYENTILSFMGNYLYIKAANCDNWNIESYKPDFIISVANLNYAIEIDGHNFHEKTKEQVQADKRKDRDYLKYGFTPIRFSGSEVYRNPIDCVRETLSIIFYTLKEKSKTERILTSFIHDVRNAYVEDRKC